MDTLCTKCGNRESKILNDEESHTKSSAAIHPGEAGKRVQVIQSTGIITELSPDRVAR